MAKDYHMFALKGIRGFARDAMAGNTSRFASKDEQKDLAPDGVDTSTHGGGESDVTDLDDVDVAGEMPEGQEPIAGHKPQKPYDSLRASGMVRDARQSFETHTLNGEKLDDATPGGGVDDNDPDKYQPPQRGSMTSKIDPDTRKKAFFWASGAKGGTGSTGDSNERVKPADVSGSGGMRSETKFGKPIKGSRFR